MNEKVTIEIDKELFEYCDEIGEKQRIPTTEVIEDIIRVHQITELKQKKLIAETYKTLDRIKKML